MTTSLRQPTKPLRITRERMWWMDPPFNAYDTWACYYDDPNAGRPVRVPFHRSTTKAQVERYCERHGFTAVFA